MHVYMWAKGLHGFMGFGIFEIYWVAWASSLNRISIVMWGGGGYIASELVDTRNTGTSFKQCLKTGPGLQAKATQL